MFNNNDCMFLRCKFFAKAIISRSAGGFPAIISSENTLGLTQGALATPTPPRCQVEIHSRWSNDPPDLISHRYSAQLAPFRFLKRGT